MSFSKLLIVAASWIVGASVFAQELQLGQPSYGGNGCPGGSASAVLSPDSQELSILFDQYIAEAGGATGRQIDRKSCNLAVPVRVPQGYSIAIFKVDYRGFTAVPSGGQVKLESEYFWAGRRGPKVRRAFNGPLSDSYTVSDQLMASAVVWSGCGADVTLRVNSNVTAQTNSRLDQTMGAVDSIDVASGLVYHFQWRPCF